MQTDHALSHSARKDLDPLISMLDRFRPHVLGVLRIMAGLMFMLHGVDKIFGGIVTGHAMGVLPPVAVAAGYIELVTGALMTLGLLTRLAAFLASGTMAFAYFMGHAKNGFVPLANGGELAVLYCFIFFYLVFAGGGPLSLDALFLERKGD